MGKSKDGGPSATWERDITITFCDLCIREIEIGNRPTTHFNKEGWMNLRKSFHEKTGRDYDKIQLKNKWDQLKKDWKIWKDLKRGSTGLGWDPIRKTIDTSDEWWKEKLEVIPSAKKFRYCGIHPDLEEKLDLMFIGVVATGLNAWTPNQGSEEIEREDDFKQLDNDTVSLEESTQNIDEPIQCSNLKRHPCTSSIGGRKKRYGSAFLRNQISQLVSACANVSSASTTSELRSGPPLISETIKILDQTKEIFDNIPLYLYVTKLLEDPTKREVFMSMVSERRVHYLLYYFENRDV